jgi:hypothetical protein
VLIDIIVALAIVADNGNSRMLFDLNISFKENDVEEHITDEKYSRTTG